MIMSFLYGTSARNYWSQILLNVTRIRNVLCISLSCYLICGVTFIRTAVRYENDSSTQWNTITFSFFEYRGIWFMASGLTCTRDLGSHYHTISVALLVVIVCDNKLTYITIANLSWHVKICGLIVLFFLNHWCQVTYICVGKLTIIVYG